MAKEKTFAATVTAGKYCRVDEDGTNCIYQVGDVVAVTQEQFDAHAHQLEKV